MAISMESRSHPARGAWIEIYAYDIRKDGKQSHPARGAWIEIIVYVVVHILC